MRSLFLRIFLTFLLTILLVVSVALTLTVLQQRNFSPLPHRDFARTAINQYGGQAIEVYERQGVLQLEPFNRQLREKSGLMLLLFDDRGEVLSRRRVPRRVKKMAQQALASDDVVFPENGQRNLLAGTLQSPSGKMYVVAIFGPDRPPSRSLMSEFVDGFLGWRLVLLLLVSALTCYLLTRSLTNPIGRLRRATQSFASGDLSVRVADQVTGADELSGLAQDFDDMAARIENLIAGQKRLLRDISHELRSPLTRLGIALELARNRPIDEAGTKAMERIALESERMNEMIGQLLELTRLESGTGVQDFAVFDLHQLLTELVRDADFEAQARSCRVLLEDCGQELMFNGSRMHIGRALENVLRNAVNYTAAETEVRLMVSRADRQVILTVTDRGPGVPQEALDKIFDPFYRVADARERSSGGSGIGLAIAARSIAMHGGQIAARNHSAGGLVIEITLALQ